MMELLLSDLKRKHPDITLDEKWVEEVAYKAYLMQAIIGLNARQPIIQNLNLFRDSLIDALMSAIPKDFPSKKNDNREMIKDAADKSIKKPYTSSVSKIAAIDIMLLWQISFNKKDSYG